MTLVDYIEYQASESLGRKSHASYDKEAVQAVEYAARQHLGSDRLWQWAIPGLTIRELSRAFVARWVQAYGPVEGLIDIGGHLGIGKPIIVRLP
jgi:hypothetical protein